MIRKSLLYVAILLLVVASIAAWACEEDPPGGGTDSPGDGATVSGVTPVQLSVASGRYPITGVDLYIDNELVTTLLPESDNATSATLKYSWDTTKADNGLHSIYAVVHAYDTVDGTVPTITVTVKNK